MKDKTNDGKLLEALEACWDAVNDGEERPNFAWIADDHGVNRRTLQRHYDKDPEVHHLNNTILNPAQETVLISQIRHLAMRRLYPAPTILRNMVHTITGTLPSRSWATRFTNRHKDKFKVLTVSGMGASRHTGEYRQAFEEYFDELGENCARHNIGAEAIFNMDKKGFMMGIINKQHRIVPIEECHKIEAPVARQDGNRTWVTFIVCVCADGTTLTPAIIFDGQSIGENWMDQLSMEDQYFVTASNKGWTNSDIGLEWLTKVFEPGTKDKEGCQEGRMLLVDGHASHVMILPPHTTHRLQPLDIGIFSPLSTAYSVYVNTWFSARDGRMFMDKASFFKAFIIHSWKQSGTVENITGAFAKAGIVPHNRAVVMDQVFTMPPES